jgi:hypothetical protein
MFFSPIRQKTNSTTVSGMPTAILYITNSETIILKRIYSGDQILIRSLKKARDHLGPEVLRTCLRNRMDPVAAASNSEEGMSLGGVLYGTVT